MCAHTHQAAICLCVSVFYLDSPAPRLCVPSLRITRPAGRGDFQIIIHIISVLYPQCAAEEVVWWRWQEQKGKSFLKWGTQHRSAGNQRTEPLAALLLFIKQGSNQLLSTVDLSTLDCSTGAVNFIVITTSNLNKK